MEAATWQIVQRLSELMSRREWLVDVVKRGWDFEIRSRVEGRPLRILIFGPQGVAGPGFIRFEWGEVSEPGRIWAVVRGVALHPDAGLGARELPSFQVALGDGWLVLGAGIWIEAWLTPEQVWTVENLWRIFAELGVEASRSGSIPWNAFTPGTSPLSPDAVMKLARSPKVGLPLGSGLIGSSVLGTAALALVDPILAFSFAYNIGLPAFVGGLFALGVHFKRQVAPRECYALARALHSSDIFDEYDPIQAVEPLQPLVVSRDRYDQRMFGTAEFRAGVLGARSSRYGIGLRLSLHTLSTSAQVLRECLIVPSLWSAIEISGPEDVLSRIPVRPREDRAPGRVFWLLDGDEIRQGALYELISALSIAVDAGHSGPYR